MKIIFLNKLKTIIKHQIKKNKYKIKKLKSNN